MDEIINVSINGYTIAKDNNCAGAQNESNSTRLRLTFDDNWKGYAKTIMFWNALGENPVKRILSTDLLEDFTDSSVYIVPIPGEAMTEAGWNTFVVDGYIDGVIKRTVEDRLRVLPSRRSDDAGVAEDPTPTQAQQLQSEIESILPNVQKEVVSARTSAELANMYQAQARESANEAEAAALQYPYVGDNGNWFVWDVDAEKYVDTGCASTGPSGVYMGTEAPTDPTVKIWLNPNGEVFCMGVDNLANGEGIDSVVQTTSDNETGDEQPKATGAGSSAFGRFNEAHGKCSMAVNYDNVVNGTYSFACCHHNEVNGNNAFASGYKNIVNGNWAVANGLGTEASGNASFTSGEKTIASGEHSHAEGYGTEATGAQSHAEGYGTEATGEQSHAEGSGTEASGIQSHAEGKDTIASGARSHAEGGQTTASGGYSHAEGRQTISSGVNSHAGGYKSESFGNSSFAHGNAVQTNNNYQVAFGQYNEPENTAVLMIGYGSATLRKNVFTVYRDNSIKVGDTILTEANLKKLLALAESESLASTEYVDTAIAGAITETLNTEV